MKREERECEGFGNNTPLLPVEDEAEQHYITLLLSLSFQPFLLII